MSASQEEFGVPTQQVGHCDVSVFAYPWDAASLGGSGGRRGGFIFILSV